MLRALAAILVLATFACGGESRTAATDEARSSESRLAGATLDGEFVSLDQFRGRPVLVNVWSSW